MIVGELPSDAPWFILLISVLSPVLVAWVTTRGTKTLKKNQADQNRVIAEVRDHVANTHQTNLRDDIDSVLRGLTEVKASQFDQSRLLNCMSDRVNDLDKKVDTYRKVSEKLWESVK